MAKNEIVGISEIAEMLGVSKQVVTNWKVRDPSFPQPLVTLAMGPIYNKRDIKTWSKTRKRGCDEG